MTKENYRLVYSQQHIIERIEDIGRRIMRDLPGGEPLTAVCVLKGAVIFFADLVKVITDRDVFFAFVSASSYGDSELSSGNVKFGYNTAEDVAGQNILIVEDIIDTGRTLYALKNYFTQQGAKSVKIACLLDKPMCRVRDIQADYVGITLDSDRYVVGYGLDNAQKYRNLSGIYEKEQ